METRKEVDILDRDLRAANLARLRRVLQAALIHDLKAPLNAATLVVDLLSRSLSREDASPDDRGRALENVEEIRRELRRLGELLPGLLSLPEPDARAPDRATIDLVATLPDLLRLLRQQALLRKVQIRTEFPKASLPVVSVGSGVEQAFLNIAMNGLEAMPNGGTLLVEARRSKGEVHWVVEDDGPGLPIELGERIWEPHVTTKNGHSGLGLAITRDLIGEHGGSIRLTPGEISGTRVEIRMPLAATSHAPGTAPMEKNECRTPS